MRTNEALRDFLGRAWIKPNGQVVPIDRLKTHITVLEPTDRDTMRSVVAGDPLARMVNRGWVYVSDDSHQIVHDGSSRSISNLADYLFDQGLLPRHANAQVDIRVLPGRARRMTLRQAVAPVAESRFRKLVQSLVEDVSSGDLSALTGAIRRDFPEVDRLTLVTDGDNVEIDELSVFSDFRGEGVGSAVLQRLVDFAEQRRATLWMDTRLRVADFNPRVMKRFGFVFGPHPELPRAGLWRRARSDRRA